MQHPAGFPYSAVDQYEICGLKERLLFLSTNNVAIVDMKPHTSYGIAI
ncbi:MAG: hypothetical protein K9M81_02775 [Chthoniobacterales bacterium]|nr:hypothetical protein [Chthoniobacterales bacterium]